MGAEVDLVVAANHHAIVEGADAASEGGVVELGVYEVDRGHRQGGVDAESEQPARPFAGLARRFGLRERGRIWWFKRGELGGMLISDLEAGSRRNPLPRVQC